MSQVFAADSKDYFFCSKQNTNEETEAYEENKPMISWDVCLIVVSHLDYDELDFGNYKTEDWPDQRSDRSKYRHQNTEDFRIKIMPNSSPSLTILGIPTIFVSRQNFRIVFGWLFPCKHVFWRLLICLVCQQTFQLVVSFCILVVFFFCSLAVVCRMTRSHTYSRLPTSLTATSCLSSLVLAERSC